MTHTKAALAVGTELHNRYQILAPLGSGGFSRTYLAEDTQNPGIKYVVKHLQPASSDAYFLETARRLFQQEVDALRVLGEYPQIPKLQDSFEQDQEFYLVQEWIEGEPLTAEISSEQRWDEAAVIELLRSILTTMKFVHGYGVIHRDLKPDNIIRRRHDQQLVIIDFGSVKQIRTMIAVGASNSASIAIGTPGYLSSEQGQGKPRPSSDLYSTGLIAIQALTGLHPSQLQDEEETGEKSWRNQAEVSDRLAFFLDKMVRYHHKDRHVSAEEALGDLQKVMDGSLKLPEVAVAQAVATPVAVVTTAEDISSSDRKSVWMQRLKTTGLFAGGICVAMGIAATVAPLLKSQQEAQNAKAIEEMCKEQKNQTKKECQKFNKPQPTATPPVAVNPRNDVTKLSVQPTVTSPRPDKEIPKRPIEPPPSPIQSSPPPVVPSVLPTPSPQPDLDLPIPPTPLPSPTPTPEPPKVTPTPSPVPKPTPSTKLPPFKPRKQVEPISVAVNRTFVDPEIAAIDPSCTPLLTAADFAFHCANSGALKKYGVYGWNILEQDLRIGNVTPKSIVATGIKAGLLPPETINDQSYINAVELHLSH
jgi:serine/threonine protein kinase